MGILGSTLSAFGLGQDDIKNVTKLTLGRVDKRDMVTADQRHGVAIGLSEMLNTLRSEDVITAATHNYCFALIEKWEATGPKAAKPPKAK